jgi:hypothetical protein
VSGPLRSFQVLATILIAASGCTKTPPDPTGKDVFQSRAIAQQEGQVTARAAVLGDDESERYFGVSLADKGMQAVWLSVKNGSSNIVSCEANETLVSVFCPNGGALREPSAPMRATIAPEDFPGVSRKVSDSDSRQNRLRILPRPETDGLGSVDTYRIHKTMAASVTTAR